MKRSVPVHMKHAPSGSQEGGVSSATTKSDTQKKRKKRRKKTMKNCFQCIFCPKNNCFNSNLQNCKNKNIPLHTQKHTSTHLLAGDAAGPSKPPSVGGLPLVENRAVYRRSVNDVIARRVTATPPPAPPAGVVHLHRQRKWEP